MMVTITSMKKIQDPDLLLDHPQPHRLSATNNLNKPHPHRGSRHAKTKNRRHYPSEESNSSAISASTTLTSVSSINGEEETQVDIPTSHTSKDGQVIIDGLDENSPWSHQEEEDSGSHKKRSRTSSQKSKSPPPTRTSWIRTKSSSSSTTRHGSRLPCCCSLVTTRQLIVLLIVTLIVSVSIISLVALVLSRSSHSEMVSSSSVSNTNSGDRGDLDSNLLLPSSDISQVHGEEGERAVDEDDEESENYDEYEESSAERRHNDKSSKIDLKDVSRLSWNMLNNNQERGSNGGGNNSGGKKDSNGEGADSSPSPKGHRHHHRTQNPPIPSSFSGILGGQEVVLPSKMIFTSSNGDLDLGSSSDSLSVPNSSDSSSKKRSCCRTQKYAQVIKKEGCESVTITNRMCFGQCLSVWVPGLFASFPVCKPSRSSWKTVTLTCGKNRDRKRRVRIEKVRRCSCMEIDPTASGSNSHISDQKR